MTELTTIALDLITAGNNDRKHFDENELRELADSIAENGLVQPPTVVADGNGGYRIVAGERRTRACRLLGWSEMPALVREMTAEEEAAAMLIENISRVDLNPIEEARAYRVRLESGASVAELAGLTGKSAAHIEKRVGLLDLIHDVQTLVASGTLPLGHAEAMRGLGGYAQTMAVKVINEATRLPTVAEFRKVCGELQAEQDQAAMFDLAALWVDRVQEAASEPPRQTRARRQRRPDLPVIHPESSFDAANSDALAEYAEALESQGFGKEAEVVWTLLTDLLDNVQTALNERRKEAARKAVATRRKRQTA